ncbi:hypothetical protein EKD04_023485 [Chloroflexales bacterium ZM16-3]|nr:hypothetical protein [Chloroflexales bacterium ZM16-3]
MDDTLIDKMLDHAPIGCVVGQIEGRRSSRLTIAQRERCLSEDTRDPLKLVGEDGGSLRVNLEELTRHQAVSGGQHALDRILGGQWDIRHTLKHPLAEVGPTRLGERIRKLIAAQTQCATAHRLSSK